VNLRWAGYLLVDILRRLVVKTRDNDAKVNAQIFGGTYRVVTDKLMFIMECTSDNRDDHLRIERTAGTGNVAKP
jgi:hypothetical protein